MHTMHSFTKRLCFITIIVSTSSLFSEPSVKKTVTQFFEHEDFVKNFIEQSSGNPDTTSIDFNKVAYTAFIACLSEDFITFKKCFSLLKKYKKIHLLNNRYPIDNGKRITLLMGASANGHAPTVSLLIQEGVSINTMNDENDTALSLAIKNHRFEVVALLLKHIKITQSEKDDLLEIAFAEQQWCQEEVVAVRRALEYTNKIIELLKKS